jgi:hypothetical protein
MTSVAADSRRRLITGLGAASIGVLRTQRWNRPTLSPRTGGTFQLRFRQPQGPRERVARGLKWSEALSRKWLYR